jgi:hypothetical protein
MIGEDCKRVLHTKEKQGLKLTTMASYLAAGTAGVREVLLLYGNDAATAAAAAGGEEAGAMEDADEEEEDDRAAAAEKAELELIQRSVDHAVAGE